MGVESYLHKYAKIVVASWLRRKIKIGKNFKGLSNIFLELESPKERPMFNVYMEFPVCKDTTGIFIGLDCEWRDWLTKQGKMDNVKSKSKIPTLYELKENFKDLKVMSIYDIGIVDKKRLKYVFEIEHKHSCSPKKIKFIKDNDLIGFEISAQKVMEQVKLPYAIECVNKWNVD